MRSTRIVTGALYRADSIEKLAILSVGNPVICYRYPGMSFPRGESLEMSAGQSG